MNEARQRILFLSVRPQYAEAILEGSKGFELRRRAPRADPGTVVLLYASSPVRALVGAFVLDAVEQAAPQALWRSLGLECGVSKVEFMNYFAELDVATALKIGTRYRVQESVPLAAIRAIWPGFQPPQSYRYVEAEQAEALFGADFDRVRLRALVDEPDSDPPTPEKVQA